MSDITQKWVGFWEFKNILVGEDDTLETIVDKVEVRLPSRDDIIMRQGGGPEFYVTEVTEEGEIYGFYLDNII